ncbi:MAG: type IV pilus assembly protein PilM [Candidatus Pacebacteria bacterium]|nr:type IV pilus assembly protein PilM [Candidatus Paceibacterota bacterium]
MPALALDIGTYTIKAISGKPGKSVVVDKAVESFNTTGIVVPTDEPQTEKLVEAVGNLISDHKLPNTDVRLSLPESIVSTKIINMPRLSDAELSSAIGWQAEQYIPIPPEELTLEYKVLYRPPKNVPNEQMRVLLVGTRKTLVEKFIMTFNYLGIEPTLLETQILSVVRSLQFENTDPTTLIVHMGANTTILAVVHQGELAFVFNHMSGSQTLTKSLQASIGLDADQAEQYKRQYGLDETQFQGKVQTALLPAVKVLTDAMQKATRFFVNQNPTASIQRVLLSGGGVQLPNFVPHITNTLGAEVLVASPFAASTGNIPEANHAAMTVCMGLLNREL